MKQKFLYPLFILFAILFFTACKKGSTPDPNPTPGVKPDTLTAGWTKTVKSAETFSDIAFQNNTTGYATSGNSIYKSTDGGITWNRITPVVPNAANLAVTNDGKVFIVSLTNQVFKSTDGGATFTPTVLASSGLMDIYFTDNNIGYTAGDAGVFKTIDGGVNWNIVNPATGLSLTPGAFKSIVATTTGQVWVSSANDIYFSGGGLGNWTKSLYSGGGPTGNTMSISALAGNVVYAASGDGKLFKSVDGGANFVLKTTFTGSLFYQDVHFVDANTGYACYVNRIYKTSDGGTSWQQVVALGEGNIIEVYFTDATHGWACGDNGALLRFN